LRAVAVYAGYRSVAGADDAAAVDEVIDIGAAQPAPDGVIPIGAAQPAPDGVIAIGAAIELLQTYFLIQDDWMDDDEERRGGPSVHTTLTRAHGNAKLGASLAILAADLAVGFAFELLHAAAFPAARRIEAYKAFTAMHFEVVCGQQLDLFGHGDVTLTHHLKTGSYTVRGPLTLGALLGDASAPQLTALERFGKPLGIAFQLRDDLLGTFGDTRTTGKPAGHDLREGKNTALVVEARALLQGAARERLDGVLGNQAATATQLQEVAQSLEECGARGRVEARLDAHLDEARAALDTAPLRPAGVAMLNELLGRITHRDR